MDILCSLIRRLLTSAGAISKLVRHVCNLLLALVLLEERRRAERLRNESAEIQNIHAYEKLLAQYARLLLNLGIAPTEVSAVISAMMIQRVRSYLQLHVMSNANENTASKLQTGDRWTAKRSQDRRQVKERLG